MEAASRFLDMYLFNVKSVFPRLVIGVASVNLLRVLITCSTLCAALCSNESTASTTKYSRGFEPDSWRANTSVFRCQIIQTIPLFGKAVFTQRAGEKPYFYLQSGSTRLKAGEAVLSARTPSWFENTQSMELARVNVKQGTRPLVLSAKQSEVMIAQLSSGFEIALSGSFWFDDTPTKNESLKNTHAKPLELGINNIGFRKAYQRYLNCLAGLVPANFDQIRRTALYFPADVKEIELPLKAIQKIEKVLTLVKHDSSIKMFFIDGHTDNEGNRQENLDVSKVRAELVADYLMRRGVPKEWIKTRWHGERYPAVPNKTRAGRAKNRRVTVRIERVEDIDVLPLAAK